MTSPHIAPIDGHHPEIHPEACITPGCYVVGRVRLDARANVWYGSVLRGDIEAIEVGQDSNIQDGCVLHADPALPTIIGDRVTVGHAALVHGATIADEVLVGMRSVVLGGATVGSGSMIAAGAVLRPGAQIPEGVLVAGVPAEIRRETTEEERRRIVGAAHHYAEQARKHVP